MSTRSRAVTSRVATSTAELAVARLEDVTEKELASQVVELATTLGYKRYHTYRSKRSPSGFPDEVLVRERVVYLELKRENTKPTADQREWLRALLNAGAEVYLVRPRNLQDLAAVLAQRDPLFFGPATKLRDELRKELA